MPYEQLNTHAASLPCDAGKGKMSKRKLLDDDGLPVAAGDTVRFNYGIPPVPVMAKIVKRHGRLIALTPTHNPKEVNVCSLRKHVGSWYKQPATGRK